MKVNEVGSSLQESCMYGSTGIKVSQSEDTNNVLLLQNSSLKFKTNYQISYSQLNYNESVKKGWVKKGLVEKGSG